jgi:hypothetical protein
MLGYSPAHALACLSERGRDVLPGDAGGGVGGLSGALQSGVCVCVSKTGRDAQGMDGGVCYRREVLLLIHEKIIVTSRIYVSNNNK